jgi:hypothetical protein
LEHQVAVEHLDPLGQEPAHALVPLAVPQGTERRLCRQLLDAVLRRDASCGPYEKRSPGVGQVGQQAFEQGLAEDPVAPVIRTRRPARASRTPFRRGGSDGIRRSWHAFREAQKPVTAGVQVSHTR